MFQQLHDRFEPRVHIVKSALIKVLPRAFCQLRARVIQRGLTMIVCLMNVYTCTVEEQDMCGDLTSVFNCPHERGIAVVIREVRISTRVYELHDIKRLLEPRGPGQSSAAFIVLLVDIGP